MKRLGWLGWILLGFLIAAISIGLTYFVLTKNEMSTRNFEHALPARPNPLMGYAPWATAHKEDIDLPYSLVYVDMTWREIEPMEGVYDFAAFEQRSHLNEWRSDGMRFVFRFVMDVPRDEEHIDIPDWLYEKLNGDGDLYDTSYGKGFSPNYANPILIEAHQKVIIAIAKRYDADAIFAFIEMGSLGHWGEWHIKVNEGLKPIPPKSIREHYVQHYISSFTNAKFLTRRPFSINSKYQIGMFNDMFGNVKATNTWLDWIQNGGDYDQTNEVGELVANPTAFQTAPIGGEITWTIPPDDLFVSDLQATIHQFENSHATFIGPGGYANPKSDPEIQRGQLELYDRIGYQFQVTSVALPRTLWFGDTIQGSLTMRNTGIAPFYFSWPVSVVGRQANRGAEVDVRFEPGIEKILPGEEMIIPFSIPITDFEDGNVDLRFSIIDPSNGSAGIHFANKEADLGMDKKELILGTVELDRPIKRLIEKIETIYDTWYPTHK